MNQQNNLQTLSIYKTIVVLSAILMISMCIVIKHFIDLNRVKDAKIEQLEESNTRLNDNLLKPR
jgi:hypothetical protein